MRAYVYRYIDIKVYIYTNMYIVAFGKLGGIGLSGWLGHELLCAQAPAQEGLLTLKQRELQHTTCATAIFCLRGSKYRTSMESGL